MGHLGHITTGRGGGATISRSGKGANARTKAMNWGTSLKSLEVVKGPLQVIISIADQKISVYDDGTLLARSSVSTGVQGHPTPVGVFSVLGKELWHRSNIYSAAPMPYMQRITWSGIALHAGLLPGHPASHGCIRLAKDFAVRLWHLTKRALA
jgi:lipoprotein-anchoring transpeptidase ErfK/SrfK